MISLDDDYIGTSKYFGVLGQDHDYYSIHGKVLDDELCVDRFVAISVHVHDDSLVEEGDEIKVKVGL